MQHSGNSIGEACGLKLANQVCLPACKVADYGDKNKWNAHIFLAIGKYRVGSPSRDKADSLAGSKAQHSFADSFRGKLQLKDATLDLIQCSDTAHLTVLSASVVSGTFMCPSLPRGKLKGTLRKDRSMR